MEAPEKLESSRKGCIPTIGLGQSSGKLERISDELELLKDLVSRQLTLFNVGFASIQHSDVRQCEMVQFKNDLENMQLPGPTSWICFPD